MFLIRGQEDARSVSQKHKHKDRHDTVVINLQSHHTCAQTLEPYVHTAIK